MTRDPRFDILFEPLRLGPKVIKNRFYQVPHCNGLGSSLPYSHAAMRGVKAEGGWGAVCTEILSIHPSSDSTPFPQVKLWDSNDEKSLRLLTEAIHEHGALAGAELAHGGFAVSNRYTREHPLAPVDIPTRRDPIQARAMDKQDIADLRRCLALCHVIVRRCRDATKAPVSADCHLRTVHFHHDIAGVIPEVNFPRAAAFTHDLLSIFDVETPRTLARRACIWQEEFSYRPENRAQQPR